jgi:hypothetical protein
VWWIGIYDILFLPSLERELRMKTRIIAITKYCSFPQEKLELKIISGGEI